MTCIFIVYVDPVSYPFNLCVLVECFQVLVTGTFATWPCDAFAYDADDRLSKLAFTPTAKQGRWRVSIPDSATPGDTTAS